MQTAADMRAKHTAAAKALPTQTKRIFWQAMLDGKNVGEAKKLAGIDDTLIAGELLIQCYDEVSIPKAIEDIV